jgi:predicted transposase/invertase (TIGR01784 family)
MKRDDTLWKGLIEDLFPEFLEFFYPRAVELLDGKASFEFLDKELQELYPSPDGNAPPKFVDKLVRVRSKAKEEEWILIHVEVQGYRDVNFPTRMFRYYYRIWDRYGHPVTAIAIFMGSATSVNQYDEECLGTKLLYEYNVYNVRGAKDEELKASNNPFALVVLAAKASLLSGKVTDEELMRQHAWIFEALNTRKIPKRKQLIMWAFLVNCVRFAKPETYRIFDKQLETITGKTNSMGVIEMLEEKGIEKGIERGIERGRTEAQAQFVTNLLAKLHLTDDQIADIAGVDLAFVERIKQALNSK